MKVQARRQHRMAAIDEWPKEHRELVHEYGLTVVLPFIQCGVRKPNQIKHLIETVLNEFSPTRGAASCQGTKRAAGWCEGETEN